MKTGENAEEPPEHAGALKGKQYTGMLQGLTAEQVFKIAGANDIRTFAMLAEDASLPAPLRQAIKDFVILIDWLSEWGQRTAIRPLLKQELSAEGLQSIFIRFLNRPPS